MREALHDIADSLTAHIPGRAAVRAASAAELGPLLAEALELSRTVAESSPGDDVSTGLADLFKWVYLVLETRNRSGSPEVSAEAAARLVRSVLRPLAAALGPAHAADILDRLRTGTMPCDGAWPETRTDVFQRWIESGFQP